MERVERGTMEMTLLLRIEDLGVGRSGVYDGRVGGHWEVETGITSELLIRVEFNN